MVHISKDGKRARANVTALFGHVGLAKVELKNASAGDIVGLCGFEDAFIGETITDSEERLPIPFVDIDPPTITMKICINDGPLAGREGKLLTARQVRERLVRETRTNVSILFADTDVAGHFEIQARGEMQIAIIVEQMRREGFEILVSRPEVIFHRDAAGTLLEPLETLYVDVPNDTLGDILQSLAGRKAEITHMEHNPHSVTVQAVVPTRGLIGYQGELLTDTRGTAIMLPKPRIQKMKPDALDRLLLHELFHVLSRNAPELRRDLYRIIGFHVCDPMALPPAMADLKLTNPDAPLIDCRIELTDDGEACWAAPILYSSSATYDAVKKPPLFQYLTFRLMKLEEHDGRWRPLVKDGDPALIDPAQSKSFADQIGQNTKYIIHPDEVLADNFVFLVMQTEKLPSPEIIERMGERLRGK